MRKLITILLISILLTGCGKEVEVKENSYIYSGYDIPIEQDYLEVSFNENTFQVYPPIEYYGEFVDSSVCSFNYITPEEDTVKFTIDIYSKKEFKKFTKESSFNRSSFNQTKRCSEEISWISNPMVVFYDTYKDNKIPVNVQAYSIVNDCYVVITASLVEQSFWDSIFRDYDKIDKDIILSTCSLYENNTNCIIDAIIMIMDNIKIGE